MTRHADIAARVMVLALAATVAGQAAEIAWLIYEAWRMP